MEDQEIKQLMTTIIQSQQEFIGDKIALTTAQKAPIEVNQDGEVQKFYGDKKIALETLVSVFDKKTGKAGRNFVEKKLEEEDLEFPDYIEPVEENKSTSITHRIKALFS